MKIATKDLKDEALLWAAVSVVWPNDSIVRCAGNEAKVSLVEIYGDDDIIKKALHLITVEPSELTGDKAREAILSALVQAKLGEFVDVPDHLV